MADTSDSSSQFFKFLVAVIVDDRCYLPMRASLGDLVAAEARSHVWFADYAKRNLDEEGLLATLEQMETICDGVRRAWVDFESEKWLEFVRVVDEAVVELNAMMAKR